MQGATNIAHFLQKYGPRGLDVGLAGLCDSAEMRFFQKGFERVGLGTVASRSELEGRRFYACDADLEDELIRALGVGAVEQILAEQGDLASFRKFQRRRRNREGPIRPESGGSWAPAEAGGSSTRRCSSPLSLLRTCQGRWPT